MRPERHYDDEALVTMLASGAGASDAHLGSCAECSEKLDSFRLVTDALHDAATWDKREISEAPNPATIASLRSFADIMAAEDIAADAFLADLLAGPRETWAATLAAHPEYRTPGTVRRLIAATDKALDTMPADAVEITGLAVSIAEGLDASAHRATTVATLRGQAWRERAYALFYTGDIARAEEATRAAQTAFIRSGSPEYELARLGIVRALVLRSLENYDQAIEVARVSGETFAVFADKTRSVSARLAEVRSRLARFEFEEAFATLSAVEAEIRDTDDSETHARVLGNLGYCCWKLGRLDQALHYHEAAAALLDVLGIETEATRTRWSVASILAENGHVDDALARFEGVRAEFKRLGMTSAATLVNLDAAEILLSRGEYEPVEQICRSAMEEFQDAGLAHTERALTAVAFLREAVAHRRATPMVVNQVREYLRRLPDQPNLLFLQPPPN